MQAGAVIMERGREAAAHLHLKAHALKQHVFASTQKWVFTTWYNK